MIGEKPDMLRDTSTCLIKKPHNSITIPLQIINWLFLHMYFVQITIFLCILDL